MTIIMLIGNNSENENLRNVTRYEAEFLANQYNMLFYEVSSLNHTNVKESIIQFTKEIMVIIPPPKIVKNELISLINTKTISHRTAKNNRYS